MGSPITHKWMWDFYTPKKQILEVFPFTDEGWLEAQEVEGRLIRPVFNIDKWCLNENCMGIYSLEQKSKAGKVGGKKIVEEKIGIFGRTQEQITEDGKRGGNKIKEFKLGIHGRTEEQHIKDSSSGGKKSKALNLGFHGRTKEQIKKDSSKGGKLGGIKGAKSTSSQRWMCTETEYVSTPGGLSSYQKVRGIDTSKRKRISQDTFQTGTQRIYRTPFLMYDFNITKEKKEVNETHTRTKTNN